MEHVEAGSASLEENHQPDSAVAKGRNCCCLGEEALPRYHTQEEE